MVATVAQFIGVFLFHWAALPGYGTAPAIAAVYSVWRVVLRIAIKSSERQRAECLATKLRQLGIDPEEV